MLHSNINKVVVNKVFISLTSIYYNGSHIPAAVIADVIVINSDNVAEDVE